MITVKKGSEELHFEDNIEGRGWACGYVENGWTATNESGEDFHGQAARSVLHRPFNADGTRD